jgi:hypothetical protein
MKLYEPKQGARAWLLAVGAVGALICGVSGPARADMLLLANTTMVTGTESSVFSFTAPASGNVTAELTNLDWPTTLSGLSFMASSGSQVLGSLSAPSLANTNTQMLTFHVSHPGTYFANVTATPGGPLDIGVYSFSLHFANGSAVPLPASGWLLAAAVIVLLGMLRSWRTRHGRETPETLTQAAAG